MELVNDYDMYSKLKIFSDFRMHQFKISIMIPDHHVTETDLLLVIKPLLVIQIFSIFPFRKGLVLSTCMALTFHLMKPTPFSLCYFRIRFKSFPGVNVPQVRRCHPINNSNLASEKEFFERI